MFTILITSNTSLPILLTYCRMSFSIVFDHSHGIDRTGTLQPQFHFDASKTFIGAIICVTTILRRAYRSTYLMLFHLTPSEQHSYIRSHTHTHTHTHKHILLEIACSLYLVNEIYSLYIVVLFLLD
jgi:hypothetical protein